MQRHTLTFRSKNKNKKGVILFCIVLTYSYLCQRYESEQYYTKDIDAIGAGRYDTLLDVSW
jgi:hypothetical protein